MKTTINLSTQRYLNHAFGLSSIDKLLFHIAHLALQLGGHRYGSFIEAATTVAKLAVYASYLEHNHSLNKTGLLHHIEPKRVKEIVREVETLLERDKFGSGLGNQEPEFLIGIPNLWIERFPWRDSESPVTVGGFTPQELEGLISQLPKHRPKAKIINEIEFFDLLHSMHHIAHQQFSTTKPKPFSNALQEHYVFKVLHSGMVTRVRQSAIDMDLYVLVRMSYSPRQVSEKLNTLFSDLAYAIENLQLWLQNAPDVLRAVETLEIKPQDQATALAELDELVRMWADKYHDETGTPVILQLSTGPYSCHRGSLS
jgi:hypothetical protein